MRNIWPRILENQWAEQQDSGTELEDKLWNFFRRRRRHSRNEELADIISVLLFGRMRRRRHARNQEVTDRFDAEPEELVDPFWLIQRGRQGSSPQMITTKDLFKKLIG